MQNIRGRTKTEQNKRKMAADLNAYLQDTLLIKEHVVRSALNSQGLESFADLEAISENDSVVRLPLKKEYLSLLKLILSILPTIVYPL